MTRCLALFVVIVVTSGCATMKPQDFAGREPRLVLEEYFAGQTKAWGIFQDRFGRLRRQFEVDIEGSWDGRTLTLVEDFRYDDGEEERRIWHITKLDDNTYEGEAEGVIGVAHGQAYGNALNWVYRFALKVGDDTWNVGFDDWLFLQSDGMLINRAEVTKYGIELGEVTLVFRKMPDRTATNADLASDVAVDQVASPRVTIVGGSNQ
jgi:hypothetical protein